MKKQLQDADREHSRRYLATVRRTQKRRVIFQGTGSTDFTGRSSIRTLFGKPVLSTPKMLDLSIGGLSDELKMFFKDLNTLLEKYPHIYLSFEKTTEVRLPMFLMIVAIQDRYDAKITVIWSKKSPYVNYLIRTSGSFGSAQKRRASMFDTDNPYIPVISGSNQEFQNLSDDLVDAIRDKHYMGDIPVNIESRISQAIVETLENVGRHAYPHEQNDENKKWWLICSIGHNDIIDQEYMYLAIYDTGRGIPLSFEDSQVFQHRVKKHYPNEYKALIRGDDTDGSKTSALKGLVRNMRSFITPLRETIGDSGLIYASMMHEITRIDDENHGQGSVSIKDVITDDPESKLLIFSNKGCYQYNRGSENEHTRIEFGNELPGTILQWSINLDELC